MKKKKSLGQNFLVNQGAIQTIGSCIDLKGASVVEVGPGEGALTEEILKQQPASLDLIELDDRLIPVLEEKFGDKVRIHHGDVLKCNIGVQSAKCKVQNGGAQELGTLNFELGTSEYIVFGNIPYYITSPIITHFLYHVSLSPTHMVFMMQKEVADKILKKDGKNSVLSLMCELRCSKIRKVIDVSPGSFSPPPKVNSTVLLFEVRNQEGGMRNQKLIELVKAGFTEKRKKLINNLRKYYPKTGDDRHETIDWENAFEQLGIDPNVRPEKVDLKVWQAMIEVI